MTCDEKARPVAHGRIIGRLQMCEADVQGRPFSHPVSVAWYYEDVSWLLREIERLSAVVSEQVAS